MTGHFVYVEQARLRLRDTPQNWMKLAQAVVDAIPVETTAVPKAFAVPDSRKLGNYPSLFPTQTRIEFELGRSASIELEVFNVAGCRIATFASGTYPAGAHRVVWSADEVPAGVYVLRLRHGGESTGRSCVELR